jgi:anhydro-N-acetylmuramic acid kinase
VSGFPDLDRCAASPSLIVLGLMAGTSADGVDAAAVRVTGTGPGLTVETLAGTTLLYRDELRTRVLGARDARAEEIAALDLELGARFADAANAVLAAGALAVADVAAIGSHGQTIAHVPGAGVAGRGARRGAATLQIGSAALIAERTGIAVVSDFRSRDVAAGGEGAPLVPYVDWLLLRPDEGVRLAQNLGGVGNVTMVTPEAGDVVAFDTGPANGPLDAAAALLSGGRLRHDEGGEAAARGTPDQAEVEALLRHPWFDTPPPRSLSRDVFAEDFVERFLARREDLSADDALATLTEFVARSVAAALRDHLPSGPGLSGVRDVVVSGGGVHNLQLMRRLAELLSPVPVRSTESVGIDPDEKEAVAFAVLAAETLRGRASSLPQVTGAAGPRVLGSLTPA